MKTQIKVNGIKQNCYRVDRDFDYKRPGKKDTTMKYYDSLEKKALPNGYIETIEKKDYPINASSVTSYADGADYKRDPVSAVANQPKRVNLGDVACVQDFIQNNPQDAVKVYRDVLAQLEKHLQKPKEEIKVEKDGEK